jgi:isocitrate dehydrogenase
MFAVRSAFRIAATRQVAMRPVSATVARGMAGTARITYTECDEAPALATISLLPIVNRFAAKANVEVVKSDISLSGRIIALFPEELKPEQRIKDELSELGKQCLDPSANVIKTPNISASIPQLNAAITELQKKGYNLPNYNPKPTTDAEKAVFEKYSKVLGSAVNPVLREGNSDRRVAGPVKEFARKNPHSMGKWSKTSRSHVAHMESGDFYGSEKSAIISKAGNLKIEHIDEAGKVTVLKAKTAVKDGEVVDASFMNAKALNAFFEKEINEAKSENIMLSLHMKATMMKVSDPVIFGHCVKTFFKDVFAKHGDTFKTLGVNVNNGFDDLLQKIKTLPEGQRKEIEEDIKKQYASRPSLAMVNSAKGITNLHIPSDVIIDASMPCVVRDSGKMWNKDDKLEDVKCLIPDRCYATMYQEIMSFCKVNGQFDVKTMGNVCNIGLMAQKAEEYGSHDKTFVVANNGTIRVTDDAGNEVFSHKVEKDDIWRMCQTKDIPIRDWVKLAVTRARITGDAAIFWLDENRAHDANLIKKVNTYLKEHDVKGLDISILPPVAAIRRSCERAKAGLDTISVTGNVLRDYLTDLFPIIELGTSAKMLSIVPLLAGGGLFETGAGGSAPKHVEQFLKEGHLRWDSLGEYLALAVSFDHLALTQNNQRAKNLGDSLNEAISRLLDKNRSPSRKVHEIDNRASNFYIALYWAEAMAKRDPEYKVLAQKLKDNRSQIIAEHKNCQGKPVDVGGYYKFDPVKVEKAMRPSETFNKILDSNW